MFRRFPILILAFLVTGTGQVLAQGQANSDLDLLRVRSLKIYSYAAEARQGRSGTGGGPEGNEVSMPPVSSSLTKYQVSIVVENVGTRQISAVTWSQPEGQRSKSPIWHKVRIRQVILPGQTVELKKSVLAESPIADHAVIEKVEFSDGTVWQRPDPKRNGARTGNDKSKQ